MPKKKPSVLIADDHQAISAGLQLLLQKHGFTVDAVDRAALAVTHAKSSPPDVVLMDTVMPGSDSFAAAEKIMKNSPDTKVVFYSASTGDTTLDCVKNIKAAGLISKEESADRLVAALNQVLAGQEYFSPDLDKRMVRTRSIQPRSRLSTLSPREREVLRLLAQDYSVRDVANELNVKPTTIETHRQSLRAKLDLRGAAGMAKFAIQEGLLEIETPPAR